MFSILYVQLDVPGGMTMKEWQRSFGLRTKRKARVPWSPDEDLGKKKGLAENENEVETRNEEEVPDAEDEEPEAVITQEKPRLKKLACRRKKAPAAASKKTKGRK